MQPMKKGYKEKEDIFLFNKTLTYPRIQRFYSNNKSSKFSGGFLEHQHSYNKPLNTHACSKKLEINYTENNKNKLLKQDKSIQK
jgi:hypothetical protein